MYNNFFGKISDIGQKFTLGHYNWLELFKKTEVPKNRKQSCFVATIGILFAFHAIIIFVYWWCSKGARM